MIHIGIDPGTKTGIAIMLDGKYEIIKTCTILEAIQTIGRFCLHDCEIHIENPNLRNTFKDGKEMTAKAQGAGSVKRDYAIWKEFCSMYPRVKMVPVHPKTVGSTFNNEKIFKAATGWQKQTSIHARDAAKMIFKFMK